MYIIERFIGIFTYWWILLTAYYLIAKLGTKHLNKILWIYVLLLTTMSFFYVPARGADLYRLIPIMHIYGGLSFSELWSGMMKSMTPIYMLYMNLIGRFKIDGLLSAVTCLLFYNNVFYILKKSAKRYKLSGLDTSLILFFFMSIGALIEVISGIRTMLGASFVAVCVYKEMVEGKNIFRNLPWYILASLFHPAVLLLSLIRFSYAFLEKSGSTLKKIIKLIILIIVSGIFYYIGKDYFLFSLEKGVAYLLYGTHSYFWEYLIGLISLFFIIYIEFLTSKIVKLDDHATYIENLLKFCKFFSILLIIFLIEYNTFHRFVIFFSIFSIPLLAYILKDSVYKKITRVNVRFLIFLVSCLLLIIASIRGNLSSLKFFEF